MAISISKLRDFLDTKELVIKKIFTISNEAVYIEILSLINLESFLLYIPSKYTMKINDEEYRTYKIKYLEMTENDDEYAHVEKDYEEIELSPHKINNEDLEKKLKENYNRPITLNSLNIKDKDDLKDVYSQVSRLKLCVQNIKYKLGIIYKNFLCSIKKDNSIECYLIKNFNKVSEKKIYICIDLENLYIHIDDINKDLIKVKESLFNVLEKNQEKNAKILEEILSQKENITLYSTNIYDKKKEIDNYVISLETLLKKINFNENQIINVIMTINKKYEDSISKGLYNDIERTHEISIYQKKLDHIYKTKEQLVKDILKWKIKKQHITLYIDKILFENSIMMNKIILNFSKLSDMIK